MKMKKKGQLLKKMMKILVNKEKLLFKNTSQWYIIGCVEQT